MKQTRSSNPASLTVREAKILTRAKKSIGISYSALVNSQLPSVPVQEGWDLVQNLLDQNLLTSLEPMVGSLCRCALCITPAGEAALQAYREARSARRRDTIFKIICALVSLALPLISPGV